MSTDQIELHLFPLPHVVLFPSVMLPLHIFEERYKAMVNGCINDEAPFGIVLLKGEQENESTIQKVGVLARVVEVERREDGRMNIWTKEPWWRGVVELLDDRPDPESEVAALADEVGELYREAYRKGIRLTGERPGKLELPTSAGDLSFMVSYVLDMDFQEKQNLLEMTSVKERLGALVAYLKHANARLEQQIHQQQIVETVRGNGDLGNPGKEH